MALMQVTDIEILVEQRKRLLTILESARRFIYPSEKEELEALIRKVKDQQNIDSELINQLNSE